MDATQNIERIMASVIHNIFFIERLNTNFLPLYLHPHFFMARYWWKILCILILLYVVIMGFFIPIPILPVGSLRESIRNLFFHVPMWYIMLTCFLTSVIYGIIFLRTNNQKYDLISSEFVQTGLWFGFLGLITGMEWASIQWGAPWSNDPKQKGAAFTLLVYVAYSVLRDSIKENDKKARLSAIYNIFAFAILIPAIYILPAHSDSLHPGAKNEGAFDTLKHTDSLLKFVSLPAFVGWILLGFWVTNIKIRIKKIQHPDLYEEIS